MDGCLGLPEVVSKDTMQRAILCSCAPGHGRHAYGWQRGATCGRLDVRRETRVKAQTAQQN